MLETLGDFQNHSFWADPRTMSLYAAAEFLQYKSDSLSFSAVIGWWTFEHHATFTRKGCTGIRRKMHRGPLPETVETLQSPLSAHCSRSSGSAGQSAR